MVKNNVARRVPRAMPNIKGEFANANLLAVGKPARRLEGAADNAVFGSVVSEAVDPIAVGLVGPLDRDAEFLAKNSCASTMVDMAMGKEDLFDRHPGLGRSALESDQIAAWVNKGTEHGRGAPEQGAILLKRRHRDDCRSKRRLAHLEVSRLSLAIAGGSLLIVSATASACRMTLNTLPPASFARF